ncbi:WD40 repeat-containing protein [Cavenderia fasciculata]|uniref:Protein transport protein SEC31 n=1 Tax=Cavenderia fasciculata TaxID=261658 RepID=F4Q2L2_CACFS|nr:WD40 repeat-containing protein [Cavenderia fasciculata]EGG16691.1 WD40 repeat-containing protein [Cavenderia fasciculata]|eukprot:XP_004355165.1 WD40 repeat-containing protein [Cavenderia fasciculata]
MSKLKELNKQATFAWCPVVGQSSLMAVGTVSGTIGLDFDTSSKLEIYSLDITNPSNQMVLKGSTTSANRFNKIVWLPTNTDQGSGIIVGGLENGSIGIWNPSLINDNEENANSMIGSAQKHTGAVQALDFNPQQPNLIASGGPDSEIFVWDLNNPASPSAYTPGTKPPQSSDCTSISWNKKVQHIIASSFYNGITSVWDLKAKKSIIQFSDRTRRCKTRSILWNPTESTQLVTASEDDDFPVIQTWDLRNALAPLRTLEGHRRGIWGLSWCPTDASLLLSCGKDNRTLCWNVDRGEVLCEIEASSDPNQWNFDVQWSPRIPALLATSSFGGSISTYSLQDVNPRITAPTVNALGVVEPSSQPQPSANSLRHPPSWLMRPVGASFGFGGRLAVFGRKKAPATSPSPPAGLQAQQIQAQQHQQMVQQQRVVKVVKVVSDAELLDRSSLLESVLQDGKFDEFCEQKIQGSSSDEDKAIWGFLRVSFDQNGKKNILNYLGFDVESTKTELARFLQTLPELKKSTPTDNNAAVVQNGTSSAPQEGGDVSNLLSNSTEEFPIKAAAPVKPIQFPGDGDENMITKALLIGDYATAVDCCLRLGRMADALVLASCGGQELWKSTMRAYFDANADKSFARVVACIARDDLATLVQSCDLADWKSTLAVLCTYASATTFKQLSGQLGDRLCTELNDTRSATLCYICAGDIDKTVDIWTDDAHESKNPSPQELVNLIEKVSVLRSSHHAQALRPSELLAHKYSRYAELLAAQGNLTSSLRYLSLLNNQDPASLVLLDRVYRATPYTQGVAPPPFPFQPVEVYAAGVKPQQQQQQPHRQQPPIGAFGSTAGMPIGNTGFPPMGHNIQQQQQPPISSHSIVPPQPIMGHNIQPPVVSHNIQPPQSIPSHNIQPPMGHSIQPPPQQHHHNVLPPVNPVNTNYSNIPPVTHSVSHPSPVITSSTLPFSPSHSQPPQFTASNPINQPFTNINPVAPHTFTSANPVAPAPAPIGPPPISSSNVNHRDNATSPSAGFATPPRANVHNPGHAHSSANVSEETKQEVAKIIELLSNGLSSMKARGVNQQKIEDVDSRLQLLIAKLNRFDLSQVAVQALSGVAKSISENEYKSASDKYIQITSTPIWNEVGSKQMVGLKRIIDLGLKP